MSRTRNRLAPRSKNGGRGESRPASSTDRSTTRRVTGGHLRAQERQLENCGGSAGPNPATGCLLPQPPPLLTPADALQTSDRQNLASAGVRPHLASASGHRRHAAVHAPRVAAAHEKTSHVGSAASRSSPPSTSNDAACLRRPRLGHALRRGVDDRYRPYQDPGTFGRGLHVGGYGGGHSIYRDRPARPRAWRVAGGASVRTPGSLTDRPAFPER